MTEKVDIKSQYASEGQVHQESKNKLASALSANHDEENKEHFDTDVHNIHLTHKHYGKKHKVHYDGKFTGENKLNPFNNNEKNPLNIFQDEIAEDYYSLTWCALKKDIWKEKYIYNEDIFLTSSNYFWLIFDFVIFAILISFTICVMLYQTFTLGKFKLANWRIEFLRILIVGFAQKLLSPEFHKGLTKLRYVVRNPGEFYYPLFAAFVPFW